MSQGKCPGGAAPLKDCLKSTKETDSRGMVFDKDGNLLTVDGKKPADEPD